MMNNKCYCGRKHEYHYRWRETIVDLYLNTYNLLFCENCSGWGDYYEYSDDKKGSIKIKNHHCMKCLRTGFMPIPLSEFYNEI